MSDVQISEIQFAINQLAKQYGLKKVSLFGSRAMQTNDDSSDIDLLVEFNEPAVSLLLIAGLKYRLEELMGREVDIIHAPVAPDSLLEIEKEVPLYG